MVADLFSSFDVIGPCWVSLLVRVVVMVATVGGVPTIQASVGDVLSRSPLVRLVQPDMPLGGVRKVLRSAPALELVLFGADIPDLRTAPVRAVLGRSVLDYMTDC